MFQSDLEFPKTDKNGKLPMEFWKCDIDDKVSNKYLWVAFAKSFIFCIFMLTYLFLVLKSTLERQKSVIFMS